MKRTFTVLVALLAMLLLATAVYAAPPTREEDEFETAYELADCSALGLGDFKVVSAGMVYEVVTTYYDNEGNMVEQHQRQKGYDNIFRDDMPDDYLTAHFTDNSWTTFDPATGEPTGTKYAGNPWNVQVPGYGNVYHIAGPYWEDGEGNYIRDAGLFVEDQEAFCAYFGS
ncbi:MAG: hypothetical protein ACK2UK_00095 [Candidatus Promineifilaceae bacterium]